MPDERYRNTRFYYIRLPSTDEPLLLPHRYLLRRLGSLRCLRSLLRRLDSLLYLIKRVSSSSYRQSHKSGRCNDRPAVSRTPVRDDLYPGSRDLVSRHHPGLLDVLLHLPCHLGWPLLMSPGSSALAVVFSAAVGLAFGFYPAFRASGLDPIAALRDE